MKKEIAKERQLSNDVHRDNLYSLINCVDSLNSLQNLIEKDAKDHSWPLTGAATQLVKLILSWCLISSVFRSTLLTKQPTVCLATFWDEKIARIQLAMPYPY